MIETNGKFKGKRIYLDGTDKDVEGFNYALELGQLGYIDEDKNLSDSGRRAADQSEV